jgi:toluene monooxygenase electron transfer component
VTRISLSGSDISWDCADKDTIMRSALRAGLGFPYECNVGSCGNCRFDIIEGEIEHVRVDPPGLSERDRLRGRRLGCQARPLSDCTVKVRLMPRYESLVRPVRQGATLLGTRDLTHDIREFRFALDTPVQFLSGQYALLSPPGVEGNRAFSMCNTGETGSEWHFQIKRVPNGQATGHLFEILSIGQRIEIDGPYGMAYLREDAPRDIVCIAGGSGLSPMISIARAMSVAPALAGRRLDFMYGGRAVRDVAGRDLLEELSGFGSNIHYHAAISTSGDADDGWNGYRGFVHELAVELFGHRLPACEIYFAGPPAMGEAVQRMLVERGVPPEQVHFDQFY